MKLQNAILRSCAAFAAIGGLLLVAAVPAAAGPRHQSGNSYRSFEYQKQQLELEKERLEQLQDRADQKVGGHRAEVIKARLEHQQDLIDDKIRDLDRRQDRIRDHRDRVEERHDGRRRYPRYYSGPVRGGYTNSGHWHWHEGNRNNGHRYGHNRPRHPRHPRHSYNNRPHHQESRPWWRYW